MKTTKVKMKVRNSVWDAWLKEVRTERNKQESEFASSIAFGLIILRRDPAVQKIIRIAADASEMSERAARRTLTAWVRGKIQILHEGRD